jgi:hypothetical protein
MGGENRKKGRENSSPEKLNKMIKMQEQNTNKFIEDMNNIVQNGSNCNSVKTLPTYIDVERPLDPGVIPKF